MHTRDEKIIMLSNMRWRQRAIGAKFDISGQRVQQIVSAHRLKERKKLAEQALFDSEIQVQVYGFNAPLAVTIWRGLHLSGLVDLGCVGCKRVSHG